MVTFAREILFEVVEDAQPLLELHYEELARHKDRVKLAPMWEKYAQLEASDANALQIFTARTDRGELVGYASFFVQPHLHFRDLFPAINDLVFVHPAHRNGTGVALLRHCERELKAFAQDIVFRAQPGTALDRLLPRIGYEHEENVWRKAL